MLRPSIAFALCALAFLFGESRAATRGDFDSDGRLTARDAEAALQMSAGLREEMPLLDMDGDGRVMSADARIILQSTTGETVTAASPSPPPVTPSLAPHARPTQSPPPIAQAPPPPPKPASDPFYAAFTIYMPGNVAGVNSGNLADVTREKLNQLKQELQRADIAHVQYKADKTPLIIRVEEAGLRTYTPEMFRAGERFAAPASITFKELPGKPLEGAFLLESIGVFSSESELRAKVPNAGSAPGPGSTGKAGGLVVLTARSADGSFSHQGKASGADVSLRLGRMEKGWSDEMKRQNLQLLVATLDLCATQMALLGDPKAAEKLAALRAFREGTLAQSEAGRKLISFYYARFSPWAKGLMLRHRATRPLFRAGCNVALLALPSAPTNASPLASSACHPHEKSASSL